MHKFDDAPLDQSIHTFTLQQKVVDETGADW